MERSFTARGAFGRVPRQLTTPLRRRRRAPTRPAARDQQDAPRRVQDGLGRLLAPLAFVWARRRLRIALIAAAATLVLLAGGFLALRNSSFVAVQQVRISGVSGPEAPAIDAALTSAARHMSTLAVNNAALLAAVAPFRVVHTLSARPHFPHGLSIAVVEQLPVAALLAGGQRTAVAADGVVLGPALGSSTLPTLGGWTVPPAGARLNDRHLLASLAVLGAAPAALAADITSTYTGPEGTTVAMRSGMVVYFGDATRPHAKWASLARVLADKGSAGAIYVDVRLPARPAAGFAAGTAPSVEAAGEPSATASPGSSETTVGSLAAGLTKGTAAEKTAGATTAPGAAGSSSQEPEEKSAPAGAEPGSGAGTEAPTQGATPGG